MTSEADIQSAILATFERIGVLAWRTQAGKVKARGGWVQLGPAGIPDVLVVVPPNGRLLGLEVKTQTGKLRETQTGWAAEATARGVAVACVRTVQEALAAFAAAGVAPIAKRAP